jgi:hypothetical protein
MKETSRTKNTADKIPARATPRCALTGGFELGHSKVVPIVMRRQHYCEKVALLTDVSELLLRV